MRSTDLARHDRYRHLRANLDQHRAAMSFRTVKQWCVVCQLFEPDETGRCPLCRPSEGDVVADLLAEPAAAPAVTDRRLEEAGLLSGDLADRDEGAA
ncbi:hypothetical protein EKO23_24325 [Nocardioides guangzhouensis]|uniref:Uncharacterized protein n=1 Tax=Nocardioides guangzhouensis TaxID=2497878 RepID=A0A4V1XXT3_9ACTN|nr:hypothetical protein [Nocardioides guangzhouensis]RYP80849.1 hypothetical protein EKO23_24325 [Nocardioides guangzhouensis]